MGGFYNRTDGVRNITSRSEENASKHIKYDRVFYTCSVYVPTSVKINVILENAYK